VAVAAQVLEIRFVERLGIAKHEFPLAKAVDEERRCLLGDTGQLRLDMVETAHGGSVVMVVMGRDEPLGNPVQRPGMKRKRDDLVRS